MAKIVRQYQPPTLSDYADYKPYLRLEFVYTCVYCELYESENGTEDVYEIDHYAPLSKFKHLKCDYTNLYYSCRTCNGIKSDHWHTADDVNKGRVYLNPCDHDPDDHFDKTTSKWIGTSDAGKWNVRRLNLDSDTVRDIRNERERSRSSIVTSMADVARILLSFGPKLKPEEQQSLLKMEQTIKALQEQFKRRDSRRRSLEE